MDYSTGTVASTWWYGICTIMSISTIHQPVHVGITGVDALTLTSSPVEPLYGQVSVCPHINVTFTCAASQISALTWFARPLLDEDNTPGLSLLTGTGFSVSIDNVLTITVVSIENITNNLGDFTTTLHIVVNDHERIQNGTNITCITKPA